MKVNFQTNKCFYTPKYNTSFTSLPYWNNSYTDVNGIVRSTQNTTEKREDLNYKKLATIIDNRFKDYETVNIMPMNVSDATELYYITDGLVERSGFETFKSRYTPILATDVCADIIERYPKRGIVYLRKDEIDDLSPRVLKQADPSKYKNISSNNKYLKSDFYKLYELNNEYKGLFEFGVCDFQERLGNMKDEGNSVVIIRNCLRQSFGDIESALIAVKLDNILKGASLLITGDYDREHMPFFMDALKSRFKEISHNIWGKIDYKYIPQKYCYSLQKCL